MSVLLLIHGLGLLSMDHPDQFQFEAALKASLVELERREAYFRALVQNSSDIISLMDEAGDVHYHSPALSRILGYVSHEFRGQQFIDNVHPHDRLRVIEAIEAVQAQRGIPIAIEYRIRQSDQEWAWLESVLTNWLDDKDIQAIVVNSRDTSERKQIETALLYQTEFEAILTQISSQFINLPPYQVDEGITQALRLIQEFLGIDQVYVYLYDTDPQILEMSYEWCAPGIPSRLTDQGYRIHSDQFKWSLDRLRRLQPVVVNGIHSLGPEAKAERQRLVERGVQSYILVPIAERRTMLGVLGLAAIRQPRFWTQEDTSLLMTLGNILASTLNQRRAEEALRASEERLNLVIEAANDAIWDWDLQTNATFWSERLFTFLGLDPASTSPHCDLFDDHIHPDDRILYEQTFENHLELHHPFYVELRMRVQGGSHEWFQVHAKAVRDTDGTPVRLVGSLTNIHARKQAEELVRASLKEKVILLKEIHHRVKNNLQIISSLLRLQASTSEDPSVAAAFADCQSRIQSIALVHERLYGSKQFEQIDIAEYIEDLVSNLSNSLNWSEDHVQIEIDVTGIYISLSQAISCGLILNELITNALKYAFAYRDKGHLWVTSQLQGDSLQIQVKDDGVGLPENFNVEPRESLGLQLVEDMVSKLEGSLEVESTPGQGTSFTITFKPEPILPTAGT